LINGGALIELDNGWRLATTRIAGDDVAEVILNGVPANREELRGYGFCEEIVAYKRRWFVVLDDAATVLPRMLAHRKPVRDLTASRSREPKNGMSSRFGRGMIGLKGWAVATAYRPEMESERTMAIRATTIEIDPQTAEALANYAASLGLTVQDYLKKHFTDANGANGIEDPDRWLDELSQGLPELPPLLRDFSTKDI
jgi:hypothetical protein